MNLVPFHLKIFSLFFWVPMRVNKSLALQGNHWDSLIKWSNSDNRVSAANQTRKQRRRINNHINYYKGAAPQICEG